MPSAGIGAFNVERIKGLGLATFGTGFHILLFTRKGPASQEFLARKKI